MVVNPTISPIISTNSPTNRTAVWRINGFRKYTIVIHHFAHSGSKFWTLTQLGFGISEQGMGAPYGN